MKKILVLMLALMLALSSAAFADSSNSGIGVPGEAEPMVTYCVVVDSQYGNGILRAEPSFEADIVEYIKNGTIIDAYSPYEFPSNYENICDWYYVEVGDLSGWMHESIVRAVDKVAILDKAATMRATPGTDGEYLRGIDKGEILLYVEEMDDGWHRVIWRGVTGYVHESTFL